MIAKFGGASLVASLLLGAWVFWFTPQDALMGITQKIMYLHVPSIWVTYLAFFVVFFCSVGYLWKRTEIFDRVAKSSAEIGLLFCGLGLITGAIWGRPTWGTYWVWDARLTTTLLLFLIYTGYLLLRAFATAGERQARLAAVIGVIGFLDIPLIHVSVQWWRTLHQPSTLFKVDSSGAPKPSMPMELLWPLLAGVVVMTLIYVYLLLLRLRIDADEIELEELLAEQ